MPGLTANPCFAHLHALLAPAGVVQFCQGSVPDESSGTCLDDNARAWLVAMYALHGDPDQPYARAIGDTTANFVAAAQLASGRFHNLADITGRFTDDIGSEDSFGRALWACGVGARCAPVERWRVIARTALSAALPAAREILSPHARAYIVLGLAAALEPSRCAAIAPVGEPLDDRLKDEIARTLREIADGLDRQFHSVSSATWTWWEHHLTWANGRMPEAMLRASVAIGEPRYAETGMRALEFLAGITQNESVFIPIGNQGWRPRDGGRAFYDQQPIEACAMVDAWLAAYRLSGDEKHRDAAEVAFDWFHGGNTERLALANPSTGGCHDGLHPGHVNRNQGAESTLSYLHAHLSIGADAGSDP
jgi:hypothetical protein